MYVAGLGKRRSFQVQSVDPHYCVEQPSAVRYVPVYIGGRELGNKFYVKGGILFSVHDGCCF